MKETAVYVRVSTTQQDMASQLPDLEKWTAAHDGPVTWFQDKFTGKTMERPGMNRMMDALNAGKLERIVVWRLDRLGRTAKGLCALFDDLRERKVDLVSLRDGFSLNSPAGRLHARILASVAEYETEVRAERVRAGQAAARAKGKRWGGSSAGGAGHETMEAVETRAARSCPGRYRADRGMARNKSQTVPGRDPKCAGPRRRGKPGHTGR